MSNDKNIVAQSGGGSKQHTPVDAPNSFVTKTTARVQFLVSDGETGGLFDQTNKLKSVFLNNVAVQNGDGTFNFANVTVDERYGLPSQTIMAGYPAIASSYNVATEVTTGAPVTYTSTTADVDAIRVTIRFPALFQQETNGDTKATTVEFQIYTRLTSGSFSLYKTVTKTDKCTAPADADFYIPRPAGTGTWQVRINRVTADNSLNTKANDIYFQAATELVLAQLPYNNRAYVGLTLTAETTGTSYPTVSFHYNGTKVRIPSNYNAATRVYTGVWSGTWSGTKYTTSNPVWNLLDMLTEKMEIDINDIDVASFYDAAVYADADVPALVNGVTSGTEPRYAFNHQYLDQRDDEWVAAQNLASVAGAVIYTAGNLVKLVQDRPTAATRSITNSNVVDGLFQYSSSTLPERITACTVYWSDPLQNGVAVPAYYEDATGVARYGLNVKEVQGFGITSEGQAMRAAKWNVETALSNLTSVVFKVGPKHASIYPGEVLTVSDSHFQQVTNEARIVSLGSGAITVDKPLVVTSGNTFTTVGSDGITLETRTITSTGTLSTFNYSGAALTAYVGSDIALTTAISPRQFKVVGIQESKTSETLEYSISAVLYDNNKFGRVDSTPVGITPVFAVNNTIPSAPLNLTFLQSSINDSGVITRKLLISWSRPTSGQVSEYMLRIRRSGANWDEYALNATSYEINPANNGIYEIEVRARNQKGTYGPKATGTYDLSIAGVEASAFNPVTDLIEYYDGGTVFSTDDLTFKWTNPTSNGLIVGTMRDFEVIIKTTGGTLLRTYYVPMVAPGSTQYTTYTYQNNVDDGGPRRSVLVEVRIRDTNNGLTDELAATFTNPAPGIPPNLNIVTGTGSTVITYNQNGEKDYEGVLIWRSATKNFTLSFDTLIFDGTETYVVDGGLNAATKYYYRVAAYDSFEKNYEGTGLNVSSEVGVTVVDDGNQANAARYSDMEGRVEPIFTPATELVNTEEYVISTVGTTSWTSIGAASNTLGLKFTKSGSAGTGTGVAHQADAYRPRGYGLYSYPATDGTWQNTAGVGSNGSFSVRADAATTGTFGLLFNTGETPDNLGVAGGWLDDTDYVVSFWAKKAAGASWTTMNIVWDNPPQTQSALLNPVLSTSYQRYAFNIKWDDGATVEVLGAMYLTVVGNTAANDIITIDRLFVERGETYHDWTPRLDELSPGSITETFIGNDAVVTRTVAAEAIVGYHIAANTIVASDKLVVGSVTKLELERNGDINHIDTKSWNPGMTMPPAGFNVDESTGGEASIVLTQGPDSALLPTWKATSADAGASDADGGFFTDPVTIDPSKTYRYVLWFKNSVSITQGLVYMGPGYGSGPDTIIQTLAGVDEVNPYFHVLYRPDVPTERWHCMVGYIYPYNATGLSNKAGIYDGTTMQKLFSGTDFKWKSATTQAALRALFYNGNATSVVYFQKPRIDLCDGSEASLQEILASGGVSGFNPINTANQDVIIADGTITAPKITVAQLDAISATIGTLRTATSGQRVEVRDNKIIVYDASNVVRVKIGDLS